MRPLHLPARAGAVVALVLLAGCPRPMRTEPVTAAVPDSVSVGYGRVARSSATAAVGSVDGDVVTAAHMVRVEEMLAGRIPGVDVRRSANGEYSIRIRGISTVMGGSEPLVIVDGMTTTFNGIGSVLAGISPHDVQRIEVLKDPSSLAIYGSRGANGVILITTRRGS